MPFPRSSGVLLHPTSLPGPYGIGDLGAGALAFIDRIAAAGQRVWQVLPLGPTGYGDSPYQSFSAFAGNTLLISLETLIHDGLLDREDVGDPAAFSDGAIDFDAVTRHREPLWPRVLDHFDRSASSAVRARFDRFSAAEARWLDDYALFMAAKGAHRQVAWPEWERDIAHRTPDGVARWSRDLGREIRTHKLTQFLFFEQWARIREHAAGRRVAILGDLPIFVAYDSADVWARREMFRLNADGRPRVVAGVPPDYFSATGQLWGNPHYRWEQLAQSGFAWWIDRMRALLRLVDRIRLDHFRGFVAAWEVPGDAATAIDGEWTPGPGSALFSAMEEGIGRPLPLVAENLGVITPEVEALREQFGLPGMAILQFAFGTDPMAHTFRPHNYPRNLVVYTGTHDNDTTVGWWSGDAGHSTRAADDITREHEYARRYLHMDRDDEPHWALIRAALASVADTAIVPVQDLLGLGSEARMNQPGTASGNWRWRLTPGQLTDDVLERLALLTQTYERA
jgi:4-alpha-glucanotransferase